MFAFLNQLEIGMASNSATKRRTRSSRKASDTNVSWTTADELSMLRSTLDVGDIAPDEGDEVFVDGRSGKRSVNNGVTKPTLSLSHPLSTAGFVEGSAVSFGEYDVSPYPKSPSIEFARKCEESAAQYIENCKRFDIIVDPSVVIALKTGWSLLQPSRRFTEGSMLPLLGILDNCDTITKLKLTNITMQDSRFRLAGNGNSNARVLRYILGRNVWVEELDLSNTGLDDDGVREICEGIKENQSLKKLNLASNHFGEAGTKYLSEAMIINRSIRDLDMSRNALGFQSINQLLCVCRPREVNVHTFGNYVFVSLDIFPRNVSLCFFDIILLFYLEFGVCVCVGGNFELGITRRCLHWQRGGQRDPHVRCRRHLQDRLSFLGVRTVFFCANVSVFVLLLISFLLHVAYE